MPLALTRRAFTLAAATASAAVATGLLPRAASAQQSYSAYAMAYFTETPDFQGADYGLHLAVSRDGLNWTPLNQNDPVATPTAGELGLRDPFAYRKRDGTFVVIATDLRGTDFTRNSQYLHVWDSVDLTGLTGYRRLHMHTMNTHTWAPTVFWDAARGQYGIVYSANNGQDVLMVNYTTDFRTVSSPQVYFSPGFPVLDGDIAVDGATTYLYYKNLSNGLIYGSRSATGAPNSFTTYTSGLIQGSAMEAPLLVRANDGSGWRLWGDSFSPVNNDYYAWSSPSIASGAWTPMNQRDYTPPLNSKHGSMVALTAAEYDALLARWGSPGWVRLKSSNFPDRFVRHANYVVRLDAYPFDPYQDQMWRMVPGLADPAGVSFESVNYAGSYMRRSGTEVRIDPDDGSAAFRAEATFYRTPGLADAAWSSFRAYGDAGYLRHWDYLLRVDPLGSGASSTDRQDATFLLTP